MESSVVGNRDNCELCCDYPRHSKMSLVLAFTPVEAESNFRKADALVATEASPMNRLVLEAAPIDRA